MQCSLESSWHAPSPLLRSKLDERIFHSKLKRSQFAKVGHIRWYNEKRIKISLGSLSPVEYRKSLGLKL
jgi:transposase InsO family protein